MCALSDLIALGIDCQPSKNGTSEGLLKRLDRSLRDETLKGKLTRCGWEKDFQLDFGVCSGKRQSHCLDTSSIIRSIKSLKG
jgi:hypothetical protein